MIIFVGVENTENSEYTLETLIVGAVGCGVSATADRRIFWGLGYQIISDYNTQRTTIMFRVTPTVPGKILKRFSSKNNPNTINVYCFLSVQFQSIIVNLVKLSPTLENIEIIALE